MLEDPRGPDLFETWHRFEQKAEHKQLDPQRFFDRWNTSLSWYRSRWSAELNDYLGNDCPDFNAVSRTLTQHVTRIRDYLTK